jgi:hypothetical protein
MEEIPVTKDMKTIDILGDKKKEYLECQTS